MKPLHYLRYLPRAAVLLSAVVWLASCGDNGPVSPDVLQIDAAKGGKGKPAGDPPIAVTFGDNATDEVTSDDRGTYEHDVCGVSATFNLRDARLFLARKLSGKQKQTCTDGITDPRRVMVAFTNPVGGSQPGGRDGSTVGANFFKVNEVQLLTEAEGTVPRTVVIGGAGCAHQLLFNPNESVEGGVQVSDVDVTKNPTGTWTAATRPFPDNVAVCIPDEHKSGKERSYYHIDFSITVEAR